MTFRSASDRGSPPEIIVSVPKGSSSNGMGTNRNFGKWQMYGTGISGSFRKHLLSSTLSVIMKNYDTFFSEEIYTDQC
jgi:hypothetical protein